MLCGCFINTSLGLIIIYCINLLISLLQQPRTAKAKAVKATEATGASEKDETSKDSCQGCVCLTCFLFKIVVSFCVGVLFTHPWGWE